MWLNCILSCKMHWIWPWMMDVDSVPVACCCYSGWASVCSMLMSLYSQASVYFLWIDRDTSSWTFIAPLSDVYLRELTQVTRLYWLPPASHPQCLFFFRFAFSYNFFSHVCTWAEWQCQSKNGTNCENVTTEAIKKKSFFSTEFWLYQDAPFLSIAVNSATFTQSMLQTLPCCFCFLLIYTLFCTFWNYELCIVSLFSFNCKVGCWKWLKSKFFFFLHSTWVNLEHKFK